jgi:hypothetical protein
MENAIYPRVTLIPTFLLRLPYPAERAAGPAWTFVHRWKERDSIRHASWIEWGCWSERTNGGPCAAEMAGAMRSSLLAESGISSGFSAGPARIRTRLGRLGSRRRTTPLTRRWPCHAGPNTKRPSGHGSVWAGARSGGARGGPGCGAGPAEPEGPGRLRRRGCWRTVRSL